jgi:hypothetical protein
MPQLCWLALAILVGKSCGALIPPSKLAASASPSVDGVAADAFDQTPSTLYRSAGAAWLEANLTGDVWRIDRYSLSVYGLHGSLEPYVPRNWSLWCHSPAASDGADSSWLLLDNRSAAAQLQVGELMHEFEVRLPHAPGCSAIRLQFEAATVLADVYLTGTWVAPDACTDHPFVDAYG